MGHTQIFDYLQKMTLKEGERVMKSSRKIALTRGIFIIALLTTGILAKASSSDTKQKTQPDNTSRNKEIVDSNQPTAMEQSNEKSDLDLVAKIRKAISHEKTLTTNAHNVKVITNGGEVYISGPISDEVDNTMLKKIVSKIVDPQKIHMNVEIIEN